MVGRTFQEIDAAKNRQTIAGVESAVQNLPPGYIQGYLVSVADTKSIDIGAGICEVAGNAARLSSTYRVPTSAFNNIPIIPSTSYHIYVDKTAKFYVYLTAPVWNDSYLAFYHQLYVYRYIGTVETNASSEFYFAKRYTADTTTDINADNVKAENFTFRGSVSSQNSSTPADGDYKSVLTKDGIMFSRYFSAISSWVAIATIAVGSAANLADCSLAGRLYANDTALMALGRFWQAPVSVGSGIQPTNIAFGQSGVGIFCDFASQNVYRTTDGTSFSSVATGFSSPYIANSVATDGAGKWIVVSQGDSSLVHIAYSSDNGASFTDLGAKTVISNYPEVSYANGTWIIGMRGSLVVYRSTDPSLLANFVSVLIPTHSINGKATYLGSNTWYVPLATATYYALSTDNGLTWTEYTTATFTGKMHSSAYGDGVLCVGTDAGELGYSTDLGATFTSATSPFGGSDDVDRMTFGTNIFVALVGANGDTARSLDLGLTWGVTYGDGSTTTPIGASSGAGLCFTASYGNAGRFYVCGWVGSYGYYSYSDYVEPNFGVAKTGETYVDLTNATQDYTPKIGETVKITFSSATSVPLHIATGDGTAYEIRLFFSNAYDTVPTDGYVSINPNNTTYSSQFKFTEIHAAGTTPVCQVETTVSSIPIAYGLPGTVIATVTNFTANKTWLSFAQYKYSSTYGGLDSWSGRWTDKTTVLSSLGTLVLPSAYSGTILVKRIL